MMQRDTGTVYSFDPSDGIQHTKVAELDEKDPFALDSNEEDFLREYLRGEKLEDIKSSLD